MEGTGVKKILKKMKANGLALDGIIHDDDASTINHADMHLESPVLYDAQSSCVEAMKRS